MKRYDYMGLKYKQVKMIGKDGHTTIGRPLLTYLNICVRKSVKTLGIIEKQFLALQDVNMSWHRALIMIEFNNYSKNVFSVNRGYQAAFI